MGLFSKARSLPIARKCMLGILGIVSQLNQVVPKNSKRILFYESHDNSTPLDNSEALCNWMIQNGLDCDYHIAYCSDSLGMLAGSRVRRVGRFAGVIEYLRSKYVFYSFGGMRIKPSSSQVVVNLWHGIPLKSIGKIAQDEAYQSERLDDFTYVLCPSERFVDIFARAFDCAKGRVLLAGYPRCDYLARPKLPLSSFKLTVPQNVTHSILWMPTFRKSLDGRFCSDYHTSKTGLPLLESFELLKETNQVLKQLNCALVIKSHNYAEVAANELSHIKWCDNAIIESSRHRLYEFVAQFDALLTDYSSIYFDWTWLDRPMAFTVDDFDEYAHKRGFSVLDPLSIMPGQHIVDTAGLYSFFASVANGRDEFAQQRRALKKEIICDPVYGNSRKLAESLGIVVGCQTGGKQ